MGEDFFLRMGSSMGSTSGRGAMGGVGECASRAVLLAELELNLHIELKDRTHITQATRAIAVGISPVRMRCATGQSAVGWCGQARPSGCGACVFVCHVLDVRCSSCSNV